jgi:hypothetical protein
MIIRFKSFIRAKARSFVGVCVVAGVLQFGALASSAQTYLFSGSLQTVTLNPGTYVITAYGAQGGSGYLTSGGLGAEMQAQFNFSTATTLTLLVGGAGATGYGGGGNGGGGGGSFVVNGTIPLIIAGGGGGSQFLEPGGNGFTGSSGGVGLGYGSGSGGTAGGGGGGGGSVDGGGGGGGGYIGDGGTYNYGFGHPPGGHGGSSFINGGAGGVSGDPLSGNGGYGGGGGGGSWGIGAGGGGGYSGGGGGGVSGGGGGGGSIIDPSAIMVLAQVSGVASPDTSPNGEIIITAVPEPTTLALAGLSGLCLFLFCRQRK